jgi:hypothetical protein
MRFLRSLTMTVGLIPALMATLPAAASAQWPVESWPPDSGSTVRILSAVLGDQSQKGTVVSAKADTLVFRPAGQLTPFPLATNNIVKLELMRGSHQRKAKGALIGFLVGAAGGAALAAATYKPTPCEFICIIDPGRGQTTFLGGTLGALGGALLGALLGTVMPAETWVPVVIPHR